MILTATTVALFLGALGHVEAQDSCDYRTVVNSYRDMLGIIGSPGASKVCCPNIVPPQAPGNDDGSVVTPDTGYRGNVAGIVFFQGACAAQVQPPGGFQWTVFWGDGTYVTQKTATLGPFQATHQYAKVVKSYLVIAYYCTTPPYPTPGCCDSLIRTIDVQA
ncbi:hypothetical protein EMCRGX_G027140 [Ephydatia muelleri]|eukprot:Em0014g189a